ncbi:MAG: hypothetical protein Q9227_007726 [Pyrenula ochraceoflavens]
MSYRPLHSQPALNEGPVNFTTGHQSGGADRIPPTSENKYGVPSRVKLLSMMDAAAIVVSLIALVSRFVLYTIYAIRSTGLMSFRQVLLCAIFYLVRSNGASLQDLDSLLRNSIFTKRANWWVTLTLLALAGIGPLLSVLYKQPFFVGWTTHNIPSIDARFGIIPPPQLDNLNGNGVALAVNRMTPFWQNRKRYPNQVPNTAYGENMLVVDGNTTAMLDTPMIQTFGNLRALLSRDPKRNQSLILSAKVNATVLNRAEIPTEERRDLNKTFDRLPCEFSDLSWCTGLSGGWWAGMLVGGDPLHKFAPATSPTVNYIGIWKQPEKFSDEAQKFVISRRQAYGNWHVNTSSIVLRSANLMIDSDPEMVPNQDPVATRTLSLDTLSQLLQEYNYRWYEFNFADSPPSFMASITWARLATLTIEDRDQHNPWYKDVNYTKSANEYSLQLEALTVSRSIWLVLVFAVHSVITIVATIAKAYLHTSPVSDGVGVISLLSIASRDHESLALLGGAGYSGVLNRAVRVWFSIEQPATDSGRPFGSIAMHLDGPDKLHRWHHPQSGEVQIGAKYQ